MYKCKYCGKEFENQRQLAGHSGWCKENPTRKCKSNFSNVKHIRKIDIIQNDLYCKYCGKQCKTINSLKQHEIRCKDNPNSIKTNNSGFIKYNKLCKDNIIHHPHFGQTKETCESLNKMCKTKQQKYLSGELTGSFTGKCQSKETKEKMRKSAIYYLHTLKNIKCPRYNKKSILYIDNLNITNNWNLQHTENGGEIQIAGYFLDGYDKELNIAFEYDEPKHYKDVENNILKQRDIERQKYIIEKLHCRFFRYNEKLDLLYEVNI